MTLSGLFFDWPYLTTLMSSGRSGAVEQLRVHVHNLSMLGISGATDNKGKVELFERGYGKDAAGIAREAITFGNTFASHYQVLHSSRPSQGQ